MDKMLLILLFSVFLKLSESQVMNKNKSYG